MLSWLLDLVWIRVHLPLPISSNKTITNSSHLPACLVHFLSIFHSISVSFCREPGAFEFRHTIDSEVHASMFMMRRAVDSSGLASMLLKSLSTSRGGRHSVMGSRSSFASYAASSLQPAPTSDRIDDEGSDIDWDKLRFGVVQTDYMYVMKCSLQDEFFRGELKRYSNIELSPSSGVLNYGQGIFEGLKAYRKMQGSGYLLFRPEENALRMQMGAERMCMPSPSTDQFVAVVKQTVLANKRWVPPQGKGALYIRPLLIGSGPVLGLAPAPEYTFLVYAAPVGTYFKEGLSPINLLVDDEVHRAMPGGTGGVKTITNYAPVLKAQVDAKGKGFTDVLYTDSVEKKYLEEASPCNIFVVKGNAISTPTTRGTILNGVTRRSIIEIAHDYGYQVEERLVSVDDLLDADEVFCTGTAVVVSPVGSITYHGQRYEYKTRGECVSQKLYKALTDIQMGHVEDRKGWTVEIN